LEKGENRPQKMVLSAAFYVREGHRITERGEAQGSRLAKKKRKGGKGRNRLIRVEKEEGVKVLLRKRLWRRGGKISFPKGSMTYFQRQIFYL